MCSFFWLNFYVEYFGYFGRKALKKSGKITVFQCCHVSRPGLNGSAILLAILQKSNVFFT
jgi:hypothetical protein